MKQHSVLSPWWSKPAIIESYLIFSARALSPLSGKLKPGAQSISLVKGFDILPEGGIQLISKEIKKHLDIPVAVLMGANLAAEVADGQFCETTIGCKDEAAGQMFKVFIEKFAFWD